MHRTYTSWFEQADNRGTSGDMVYDILNDWKADVSAMTADARKVEEELAQAKGEAACAYTVIEGMHASCKDLRQRIAALTAEVAGMRGALEQYADPTNYHKRVVPYVNSMGRECDFEYLDIDIGPEIAQQALGKEAT